MKKTKKDLISEIFVDFNKGLHVRDIARELIERNLEKGISESDLISKISNILSVDIKKHKAKSRFRRVPNNKGGYKQGWYKLKKIKKSSRDISIKGMEGGIKTEIPKISTLYTGKAGEYAVLSELLFNGFNASLMSVDQGIDIVASKNEKFFHIQVKTANNRNGTFSASIAKKQFERFNTANTFYIFVLRYFLNADTISGFIVLGSFDIERFLDTGVLKKTDTLSFNITIDKGKIILNNKENISFFFNRFSSLR